MAEKGKPKNTSFKLQGNVVWWKAAILAAIVFGAVWYGTNQVNHQIALNKIPKVDVFDEFGLLRQKDGFSCAPSSMAMFFHDEGVNASRHEIIRISGTSFTAGTTEKGMRKAAKHFGYELSVKEMDFDEIREYGKPVILGEMHLDIPHVSYIRQYENENIEQLEILDPLDGRMVLTKGGFYEYYGEPGSKKKCYVFAKMDQD